MNKDISALISNCLKVNLTPDYYSIMGSYVYRI